MFSFFLYLIRANVKFKATTKNLKKLRFWRENLIMVSTSTRIFVLVAFVYSFLFSQCNCKKDARSALTRTAIPVDRNKNNEGDITSSENAELIISNFLQKYSDDLANERNKPRFHIQGWRWHTLSLVRDTNRLEKLALQLLSNKKLDDKSEKDIDSAASHVIDFSMKGLHGIENDLFFPWLKKRFRGDFSNGKQLNIGGNDNIFKQLGEAYIHLLNDIDRERDFISKLGEAVVSMQCWN